ncbi:MAG: hypothetical protein Q8Q79_01235 [Sphingopyxis sp.]|nr:hypothetical protein [Sphingopyxis sp.]
MSTARPLAVTRSQPLVAKARISGDPPAISCDRKNGISSISVLPVTRSFALPDAARSR